MSATPLSPVEVPAANRMPKCFAACSNDDSASLQEIVTSAERASGTVPGQVAAEPSYVFSGPGGPLESWLEGEMERRFAVVNNKVDHLIAMVDSAAVSLLTQRAVEALGSQCDRLSDIVARFDRRDTSELAYVFRPGEERPYGSGQRDSQNMMSSGNSRSSRSPLHAPAPGYETERVSFSENPQFVDENMVDVWPLTEKNLRKWEKYLEETGQNQNQDALGDFPKVRASLDKAESSLDASGGDDQDQVDQEVGDGDQDVSGVSKQPSSPEGKSQGNKAKAEVRIMAGGGTNQDLGMRSLGAASMRSSAAASGRLARHRRDVGWIGVQVWKFLEDPDSSIFAYIYSWAHMFFVMSGVMLLLAMTISPPPIPRNIAAFMDLTFDFLLMVELAVRVTVCPMSHMRFIQDPFNLLDIFSSVLPLSIRITQGVLIQDTIDSGNWAVKLMFCVVPTLRLMKMLRRFQKYQLLTAAFVLIFEALPVLLFTFMVMALVFSAAVYIAEYDQPDTKFGTLAISIWCTVVTMTTVGYGDRIPATVIGKCIAIAMMVASAIYMAMPIGIAGNAFQLVWSDRDRILLMKRARDKIQEWGYNAEDIPALFHQFDVDSSGELDMDEFRQMITEMGIGLSDERIVSLFESIDADGSGAIDDREFIKCLFPRLHHKMQKREINKRKREERQAELRERRREREEAEANGTLRPSMWGRMVNQLGFELPVPREVS